MAALDAWRREQINGAFDKLSGLAGAATDAVRSAVERGNAHLAFRLLQRLGAAAPPPQCDVPGEGISGQVVSRWTFEIVNPGNRHADVEAYLAGLLRGDGRVAGNVTYRSFRFPYGLRRPEADEVAKELCERGAEVMLREVTITFVDRGMPDDYKAGGDHVLPSVMGAPAWLTTLPASGSGGDSNRFPTSPEIVAHHDAIARRVNELAAMDAADSRPVDGRLIVEPVLERNE